MFLRLVGPRNMTLSGGICMAWKNSASSCGGNVAVKNTICVPHFTISAPNALNLGRKSGPLSKTTWHSSITTRSNWYVLRNRLMYVLNVFVTADSGVTNTMDAVSCGLRLSHWTHSIRASLHRLSKSSCNEHNGMMTTVVPPFTQYAGNINNMLFPSPVAMILTMGLWPVITACMLCSCIPRNSAFGPINSFIFLWMLTWHICLNR